jgi:phage/plasmid primase-like uncharacterized protein
MTGARYDWDAIRALNPVEEVVARTVPLKRIGREYKGLCPFHNERTPSFHVIPDKGFYHCFGCGAHGDVIDFVANTQGISTMDALEQLARGDASGVKMTPADREARDRLLAERDAQHERDRASATAKAQARWDAGSDCHGHPYLTRKGVDAHSCRVEGERLLLPIYGADGEIISVQTIDGDGAKMFQKGAPTKGGRMWIGIHLGRTIVCEGYATGASIHEATADQVCVTFSKGNMAVVARELAASGLSIVLAADTNAGDEMRTLAAELNCPVVVPAAGGDFNDQAQDQGHVSVLATFTSALRAYADEKRRAEEEEAAESQPVDLWKRFDPPAFPAGMLPDVIERFAVGRSRQMGVDPGGLAMSALTACAAVIRDRIKVKVKEHEDWFESARLWTMLVGDPSYKKSPIMKAATRAVKRLDKELLYEGNKRLAEWQENGGTKGSDPKPASPRLRMEDTTMEAAQEICRDSPDGVLCLQDELSAFFGGIEKYSGKGGGAKDRGFWLQAYGGGEYAVDRVTRGRYLIECVSITMLGGVQPDPIRRIVAEASDDGLIQRFLPVILRPSEVGTDEPAGEVQDEYDNVITRLFHLQAPDSVLGDLPLRFDEGAKRIREQLEIKHHRQVQHMETVNRKLASHIGKFDGLFPRLCLIWHCIDHVTTSDGRSPPIEISEATASKVAQFLHGYIMRHSLSFYANTIGVSQDQDQICEVAGYILAKRLEDISMRTLGRGSRTMRRLTREEGARIFEQLEAFGWLEQVNKRSDAPSWKVNPEVHTLFAAKADEERVRRIEARTAILDMLGE